MKAAHYIGLFALGLCCTSTSLVAQSSGSSMDSDKKFVMMADEGNSAEIAASQMALKKAKSPDVKSYAQQMITDHEKLRSDMAPLAQQMNVKTPQPLNSTHKVEAQRLASMSGNSFDKEYLKAMDADHHKTLAMFKNEEATTTNPDVKTAVSQGITVIQQHTDMADQLSQKMGVPTAPAM